MAELYRPPEVPLADIPEEEVELVRQSLQNEETPYRTIAGIEQETGVHPAHIANVLFHSGMARRAIGASEDGQALFAAKELPLSRREKWNYVLGVLTREHR